MNGSMCWFEVGHCFLSVVAVNGTTTAQGLNLPQCPQMWTLILVSTNVDTILYLYLRLLTLPIIHSTCSSITIELLSCVSHCFPVRFFISFLVCFSVQVESRAVYPSKIWRNRYVRVHTWSQIEVFRYRQVCTRYLTPLCQVSGRYRSGMHNLPRTEKIGKIAQNLSLTFIEHPRF